MKTHLWVLLLVSIALSIDAKPATPTEKQENKRPEQFILFHRDSRNWAVAFQHHGGDVIGIEWTVNQEPVTNWTELVTEQIIFADTKQISAQDYANYFVSGLNKPESIDFQAIAIIDTPNEVVFEWSHKGSGQWPAQREITQVFRGEDAIYRVAYTVKESNYNAKIYKQWLTNIKDARLESHSKWMGSPKETAPAKNKQLDNSKEPSDNAPVNSPADEEIK